MTAYYLKVHAAKAGVIETRHFEASSDKEAAGICGQAAREQFERSDCRVTAVMVFRADGSQLEAS